MTTHTTAARYSLQTISGRLVRLPITRAEYGQMMLYLLGNLTRSGCDGTLRRAREWTRSRGISWPQLKRALHYGGGFCDCEVLQNLIDEQTYRRACERDEEYQDAEEYRDVFGLYPWEDDEAGGDDANDNEDSGTEDSGTEDSGTEDSGTEDDDEDPRAGLGPGPPRR